MVETIHYVLKNTRQYKVRVINSNWLTTRIIAKEQAIYMWIDANKISFQDWDWYADTCITFMKEDDAIACYLKFGIDSKDAK